MSNSHAHHASLIKNNSSDTASSTVTVPAEKKIVEDLFSYYATEVFKAVKKSIHLSLEKYLNCVTLVTIPISSLFFICDYKVVSLFNNKCQMYMKEMFSSYIQDNNTCNNAQKLRLLYSETNKAQQPYLGPSLWNKIDTECKLIGGIKISKHSLKNTFLKSGTKFEDSSIFFSMCGCVVCKVTLVVVML